METQTIYITINLDETTLNAHANLQEAARFIMSFEEKFIFEDTYQVSLEGDWEVKQIRGLQVIDMMAECEEVCNEIAEEILKDRRELEGHNVTEMYR